MNRCRVNKSQNR